MRGLPKIPSMRLIEGRCTTDDFQCREYSKSPCRCLAAKGKGHPVPHSHRCSRIAMWEGGVCFQHDKLLREESQRPGGFRPQSRR